MGGVVGRLGLVKVVDGKVCAGCIVLKSRQYFTRNALLKGGLSRLCIECTRLERQKYA